MQQYERFYTESKARLWRAFRLDASLFEDLFQDAFVESYAYIRGKYDPAKAVGGFSVDEKEMRFFCQCLYLRMLNGLKKEKKRKVFSFDFQDEVVENKLFQFVEEKDFESKTERTSLFTTSHMIDSKMKGGLLSIEESLNDDTISRLCRYNLPGLKRKSWTTETKITEKNYWKIFSQASPTPGSTTPHSAFKIQHWIKYSSIK